MSRIFSHIITMFLLTALFNSCKSQPANIVRAFYYWKSSEYSIESKDLLYLRDKGIQKLYVKFFEVDLDTILGAYPTSKTKLHIWNESFDANLSFMQNVEIIPAIFIKNKVLLNASKESLDSLAENILFLTKKHFKEQIKNNGTGFREIQMDCDWTETTRDNYFYLLKKIKDLSQVTVSCTLRLYPYKYRDKMGIPPADKAVLMCYNLVNPLASEDKNSILSNEEFEKYLKHTKSYPLHLDFALPIFSWMQVYQNNQFAGIINPMPHEMDGVMRAVKPLWYKVTQDKEIDNLYLRPGDKIKFEEVTETNIKEAISILKKYIKLDSTETVILFHFDEQNLKKFDDETLNSFFTDFSK